LRQPVAEYRESAEAAVTIAAILSSSVAPKNRALTAADASIARSLRLRRWQLAGDRRMTEWHGRNCRSGNLGSLAEIEDHK
jgi:hypothetical protein